MPKEQTVERSTHIAAPPDVVWEVLEDVRLLPEFSPSTTEVDAPPRLRAVGDRFTQTVRIAGRTFTSEWTVEEIDAPHRLVIAGAVVPGTHYEMDEEVTPTDDGATFTLRMRYRLPFGPLGRLAAKLGVERRATDEAELVIDGVRRTAEERAGATGSSRPATRTRSRR